MLLLPKEWSTFWCPFISDYHTWINLCRQFYGFHHLASRGLPPRFQATKNVFELSISLDFNMDTARHSPRHAQTRRHLSPYFSLGVTPNHICGAKSMMLAPKESSKVRRPPPSKPKEFIHFTKSMWLPPKESSKSRKPPPSKPKEF